MPIWSCIHITISRDCMCVAREGLDVSDSRLCLVYLIFILDELNRRRVHLLVQWAWDDTTMQAPADGGDAR